MHRYHAVLISLIVLSLALTSCGPGQLLGPTVTPTSTPTPAPTATPTPHPLISKLSNSIQGYITAFDIRVDTLDSLIPDSIKSGLGEIQEQITVAVRTKNWKPANDKWAELSSLYVAWSSNILRLKLSGVNLGDPRLTGLEQSKDALSLLLNEIYAGIKELEKE